MSKKTTAMAAGWLGRAVVCALFGVAAVGCGAELEPGDSGEATADGVRKVVSGKADAWNFRNAPENFRIDLEYRFDQLPDRGQVTHKSWADSYWPYYEDGINARWQGSQVLSPAEKYDKAFNNWMEPDGFMDLKPFNRRTCEWDEAYYQALGPAANHTHRTRGNWLVTNGVDDDRDGVADKDECTQEVATGSRWDLDGIEGWFGVCHAWAPAAIMEEEPLKPVVRNGITFETSDIKALIIAQYDRTSAYMIGGRCNEHEIERDEQGRITNDDCRDINAGSFHLIVTNLLGKYDRPMVIERTTNYEVWNQPFVGYEVTQQREIDVAEAHRLLGVEGDEAGGTGEVHHGIEEGSLEARALLRLANEADLAMLDTEAGLDSRAANNIIRRRAGSDGLLGTDDDLVVRTLAELEAISWVGASTFTQLRDYAMANGYDRGLVAYKYNPKAVRFVEIHMTTEWITESRPMTTPTSNNIEQWTKHDRYRYILELDAEGLIIGGEWVGRGQHPDFLWLPTRPSSGNPFIDLATVREMIAESRADIGGGGEPTTGDTVTVSSDESVAVPDNHPEGVSSTLTVDAAGRVGAVRLSMAIDHSYRGDMQIELRHNGTAVLVFDGGSVEQPWDDGISLENVELDGFGDLDAAGEWTLHMVDTYAADTGTLTGWSLEITTTP